MQNLGAALLTEGSNIKNSADPGLLALVMLLRFHGLGADPQQILHRFGAAAIGVHEMLRCAKDLGLKARSRLTTWDRLESTPLPAIAALRDGGFLVLGKVGDGKALVQSPMSPRPTLMTRAEFEAVWDGHIVLMTRRAGLVDLSRRFDITWFLGAIHKYQRLLGEVLVASFFLQVFALVSPLFFQVVIDKVLVHRTLSTLDVLIIGLVAIAIFETILGIPEGTLRWRAITSPTVHHAAYWLIIATEGLAGVLCLAGAYKMILARKAGTDIFNQSKNLALWGLGIALALYLIGFMVIGAEWFAMWQSQRWDGRQPAFRILMCIGIIILIVLQDDNKRVGQRD